MKRFDGRVVLVTAGASGIGKAVAIRLASEGAKVVIWDRDDAALAAVLRESAHLEDTIQAQSVDLLDRQAIDDGVSRLIEVHRRIDVLVNNIGGSLHTPFHLLDITDEDWDRVIDTNVTACVRTTRAVIPHMQRARYGRIINMGSKAGRFGSLFAGANYVAAKGQCRRSRFRSRRSSAHSASPATPLLPERSSRRASKVSSVRDRVRQSVRG